MKYVNQLEYPHWLYVTRTQMETPEMREKGKTTTIRSSGCGLCSAVMVADRLIPNCDFDLKAALDISYETEANYKRGTSYTRFAPAFAKKLGLKYQPTDDVEELKECLRTGGAAVAYVVEENDRIGLFTHGKHYIAVIGIEADGRVAILDPSYFEGKYEEEGRAGKVEMKYGVIALCDPSVLDINCGTENASYHLFWRE